MLVEVNIDALVGPTHHFGGVGVGNLASAQHAHQIAHPRRAALEGLDKAAAIARLGIPQFIFPPLARPDRKLLGELGFQGDFSQQCADALQHQPQAYSAVFSSAYMWAANAAVFTPASDALDNCNHLTLANLVSSWHRNSEWHSREAQLRAMFDTIPIESGLATHVHAALPAVMPLRDEGAANHMRLCNQNGNVGLNIFVYGESDAHQREDSLHRFAARQTLAACQAIARRHQLSPGRTFFLRQHPAAVDAGVFHNDVIATSHQNVLLYHELAFADAQRELDRIASIYARECGQELQLRCVTEQQLSLTEAVQSYLFNSQLLDSQSSASVRLVASELSEAEKSSMKSSGSHRNTESRMVLLSAAQGARMPRVRALIEGWIADDDNPIDEVHYVGLEQSMAGGGGPACLRLRLQLPSQFVATFAPDYRLTQRRESQLRDVITHTYPDTLRWDEMASQQSLAQFALAYEALTQCFQP